MMILCLLTERESPTAGIAENSAVVVHTLAVFSTPQHRGFCTKWLQALHRTLYVMRLRYKPIGTYTDRTPAANAVNGKRVHSTNLCSNQMHFKMILSAARKMNIYARGHNNNKQITKLKEGRKSFLTRQSTMTLT